MGNDQSGHLKWVHKINNDYELAIRLSKELEYYLELHFNATGRGLHEKITTAERNFNATQQNYKFPTQLVRNMRRLATIRNKLIHERSYHKIEDKDRFIQTFEQSYAQLQQIVIKINSKNKTKKKEDCIIL
eukprot:201431_1